jgi:hypothetical protein
MDILASKINAKEVRDALQCLPKTLAESYDNAMERIEDCYRDLAHSAFSWVANAKRPLETRELQVVLAIEPGTTSLDKENITSVDTILLACVGLVVEELGKDNKPSIVRLTHYTTEKYLQQRFPDAQTQITHSLLTFLGF